MSTPSLVGMPIEILEKILSHILHEDHEEDPVKGWNSMGCTKIMTVSRRIHAVAHDLLSSIEQILILRGQKSAVFRNPFAFGKPGYFRSYGKFTRIAIPPRFCEIQVIRFRRLVIEIEYPCTAPYYHTDAEIVARLEHQIAEVLRTLRKTKALELLTIRTRNSSGQRHMAEERDSEHEIYWSRRIYIALEPVIGIAKEKGFKLIIETHKLFPESRTISGGPCLRFLGFRYRPEYEDEVALAMGSFKELCAPNDTVSDSTHSSTQVYKPSYEDFASKYIFSGKEYGSLLYGTRTQCDVTEDLMKVAKEHVQMVYSSLDPLSLNEHDEDDHLIKLDWMVAWRKYVREATCGKKLSPSLKTWSLAPECRACLAIFESEDDLLAHVLKEKPTHARPFKYHQYHNLYSKEPSREASKHKCAICAMPFNTLCRLKGHQQRTGHVGRQMVGRWRFGGPNVGSSAKRDKAKKPRESQESHWRE